MHTHSTYSVAVSCLDGLNSSDVLPPLTAYYVMRVGSLPLVLTAVLPDPVLACNYFVGRARGRPGQYLARCDVRLPAWAACRRQARVFHSIEQFRSARAHKSWGTSPGEERLAEVRRSELRGNRIRVLTR